LAQLALMLEAIIPGTARQLEAWLRLHDECPCMGRHPAGKQIRISGIR
jgi:hypothetical protein